MPVLSSPIQYKNESEVLPKPIDLKIDDYIELYKEIRYTHDFEDDEQSIIKLENIAGNDYF